MSMNNLLTDPIQDAEHSECGGIQVDTKRAGTGRVRRLVYPVGFRWSTHVKPLVGTDLCMHAHVGFLASGTIGVRFRDGCEKTYTAPQFLIVEPGHEGWNPGNEPAVLIEFDFEGNTVERFGLAAQHQHAERR